MDSGRVASVLVGLSSRCCGCLALLCAIFRCCKWHGLRCRYSDADVVGELIDPKRYNLCKPIATAMGLDTRADGTLWKDKAMHLLNEAVVTSYQSAGWKMEDHHTMLGTFFQWYQKEKASRGYCPGARLWPPLLALPSPAPSARLRLLQPSRGSLRACACAARRPQGLALLLGRLPLVSAAAARPRARRARRRWCVLPDAAGLHPSLIDAIKGHAVHSQRLQRWQRPRRSSAAAADSSARLMSARAACR